jgi:predicted nuclease of predicted toxin-antitoxin system
MKRSDSSAPRRRREPIVFFIDRCLESATVIEKLRAADVALELHKDHFAQDAEDTEWLPAVAERKWVVLTRDKQVKRNELERQCLLLPGARSFILTGGNMTGEEMAAVLIKHLRKMTKIARKHPAPFIATVNRNEVKVIAPVEVNEGSQ